MGRKVALVSCARRKTGNASVAESLYTSDLFRKAGRLADQRFDSWYILSAKHGLLEPNQEIEPYDETLNRLATDVRKAWATRVEQQLGAVLLPEDEIFFFAGLRYREFLEPLLQERGFMTHAPMAGLSIGRQLQWLSTQLADKQRLADIDRFYDLLKRLTLNGVNGRIMGDSSGKLEWPKRGLYFFFDPDERRFFDLNTCRVVRVGTHGVSQGSKSTLWGRLRTHRGSSDQRGNHRGSIFRLHLGAALQAARLVTEVPTWGIGQSADGGTKASEVEVEKKVSEYLVRMAVIFLEVGDEPSAKSDRAYLERNVIGMLCGPRGPVDLPSESWLGRFSRSPEIRYSGLWNVDFVRFQYDPHFLDVLDRYVDVTLGRCPPPSGPLAPSDWHSKQQERATTQLTLSFDDVAIKE